MADDEIDSGETAALNQTLDGVEARTRSLAISANGFAAAMTRAFQQATVGGRQFDDVLKSLALRLSAMVPAAAFKPIVAGIAGGLGSMFGGGVMPNALGGIKPFAAGGVIGTPTYFPLMQGGVGLAGEAGPEAIMPLARGPDGRLGVAAGGTGARSSITVQIMTPDPDSFRRSESYVTGQIARAVARGQRSL
jgi:phage-related minor tail protein